MELEKIIDCNHAVKSILNSEPSEVHNYVSQWAGPNLFIKARTGRYSFGRIITELYELTGNIEASFSSKILATIDSSKPIWDQYVLHNLGLKLTGKTAVEKLQNAIELYSKIEKWYDNYLSSAEGQRNIEVFDNLLPDYRWINDVKKIDCLLWSKRE